MVNGNTRGVNIELNWKFTPEGDGSIDDQEEIKNTIHDRHDSTLTTELIKAIDVNDLNGVQNALSSGADPKETSKPLLITPLHFAAWRGHLQIVSLLADTAADINAVDCFGRTAVYLAAAMGHTECVLYLAEKGSKLDLATGKVDWGMMPGLFIWLSRSVLPRLIPGGGTFKSDSYYLGIENELSFDDKMIDGVEEGESIELSPVNNEGGTEQDGSLPNPDESINLIVEHSENFINVDLSQEPTELIEAIDVNDLDGVQNALSSGADPKETSKPLLITPLHFAAWRGHLQIVSLLAETAADINAEDCFGRTAVYLAAAMGHTECVLYLAEKGSKLDLATGKVDWGMMPGLSIWLSGSVLPRLIPGGGTFKSDSYYLGIEMPLDDRGNMTPLHVAVKENQLGCVSVILEAGGKVDAVDALGMQPILHAGSRVKPGEIDAIKMYEEVLNALLENGADGKAFFSDSDTSTSALRIAASLGSVRAVNMLIEKNADPKWGVDCGDGRTVLHDASRRGHLSVLKIMLQFEKYKKHRGAWVNQKDKEGNTSLHLAAYSGHKSCISLLLEEGGNLGVRNNAGVSAMEAIFLHVPNPKEFIYEILDFGISCNSFPEDDKELELRLNFEILLPDGGNKQTEVVNSIITTRRVKADICAEIMDHPLLKAFLELKWNRNSRRFYFLVVLYTISTLTLSLHTYLGIAQPEMVGWNKALRWINFSFVFFLLLHVFFRLWRNFRYYICRTEILSNGVGAILTMTGIIMLEAGSYEKLRMDLISISCVLLWFGFMLFLGQLPYLGTRALIFSDVFRNVCLTLLPYTFIMIGFSLFFFVQFHSTHFQFDGISTSMESTIAMITGDIEHKEIFPEKLRMTTGFTIRFIVLVFMVIASIVLLNLIVGLAVSDRDSMVSEGQIRRLYCLAEFLDFLDIVPFLPPKVLSSKFTVRPYEVKRKCILGFEDSLPEKLKGELVSLAVRRKNVENSHLC